MIRVERYKKIFGEDFEIPKLPEKKVWGIRVNTLKISVREFKRRFLYKYEHEKIPWVENGFWVYSNELLSKKMEHVLGYFFIQNASSMLPPIILEPKEDEEILDLCAAPGGKTTHIAELLENRGLVIANDVSNERLKALRGNLQRCGVVNVVVTKAKGQHFWKFGKKFDKILVDAPCTATGHLSPRVLQTTSYSSIKMLSKLQKRLLSSAIKCLKKDGMIVYSTCSLEPEENEEVVDYVCKKFGVEVEEIDVRNELFLNGIREWEDKEYGEYVEKCLRIKPTEKTEGFFVCKLRK